MPGLPAIVQERFDVLRETGDLPLPLLPEGVTRILAILDRPACGAREVTEVIRTDPSLAAHVLRVASSPIYARGTRVVSLQQMIAQLGFAELRRIALVVATGSRTFSVRGFEAEVRGSFVHSVATALFAQEIARTRRRGVDEAFLAGLLHDIGRPVVITILADLHREAGIAPDRSAVGEVVAEAHAAVGASLIEAWKLPQKIAETVRTHHDVAMGELANVIALADALAHVALDSAPPPAPDLGARLDLYPEDVDAIVAKLPDIRTSVESFA